VSLFTLARRMGTSVEQIDKTYGHLLPDAEDYERRLLDAFDARADEASPRASGLGLVPPRRGLLHLLVTLPLLFVEELLRGLLVVQRLGGRTPAGVAKTRAVWARIGHRLRLPGLPAA
jgi:hypothetical protein